MRPRSPASCSLALGLVLALAASSCSGPQKPAPKRGATDSPTKTIKAPAGKATTAAKAPVSAAAAKETERKAKNKRVFGEVRVILKSKHSQLPELERKPTDSKEDPSARIVNETPYGLTVWFAGPCSDKTEVQANGKSETRFCPGTYHIAAKVDSPDFLPLVRESQDFELGIAYVLKIIIRAQPQVIKRTRR